MTARAAGDLVVLREDEPQVAALRADGWSVVGTSWGARLTVAEKVTVDALRAAVDAAEAAGWTVARLGPLDAPAVVQVDRESLDDYPADAVATYHAVPDERELARALAGDWRAYGARQPDGTLGAVTVMRPDEDRIETEFTVTRAAVRRRGLASAVKAFGILDHVGAGHLTFGTGGHAANTASIRVNERLGYVLEPRWLTLRRP
ncbi:acetyltransferase [uncultured Cellulomonas sp.]|uniref:acetyltransferase n=1 Tax=uncultured Cellulomonas sp. TaxID=189682 RepID=UPI0028E5DCF4|nr:acetyltransferase [uncultured Cellulomonas sp.]